MHGGVMGMAAQEAGVSEGKNCSALGSESCRASVTVLMNVGFLSCERLWDLLQRRR